MTKTIQLTERRIEGPGNSRYSAATSMSFSVTTGYTFILLVFQFAKGLLDSPQFATVVGTGYLASSAAERGTDSNLMYLVFASAPSRGRRSELIVTDRNETSHE
jgi:hypothetical protein